MTPVSDSQKQLIFDYCLGLTTEPEAVEVRLLITSNPCASEIYEKLRAVFAPLECFEVESCPDELVESTIFRLNNAAHSRKVGLEQLLAAEQLRSGPSLKGVWWNFSRRLAMAAVFVVVGSVLITATNYARVKCRQQQCQMQLGRIFEGANNYAADHEGRMPSVATTAGEPWWKVGYPGKENQSNTRHLWLLVKDNYVKPEDFVCGSSRRGMILRLDPSKLQKYNDFPDRSFVTYSFRIRCPQGDAGNSEGILAADLSPLFENLPKEYSVPLKIELNNDLLNRNSINHSRRGQNVMFTDGSVSFTKVRRVGLAQDDIFTLRGVPVYKGVEIPSCANDIFLAP